MRGLPPCSRAVTAAAAAVTASSSLVARRLLEGLFIYPVAAILFQAKVVLFIPVFSLHYCILRLPHVTVEGGNVLNLATLLPSVENDDCLVVINETVTPRSDLCVCVPYLSS